MRKIEIIAILFLFLSFACSEDIKNNHLTDTGQSDITLTDVVRDIDTQDVNRDGEIGPADIGDEDISTDIGLDIVTIDIQLDVNEGEITEEISDVVLEDTEVVDIAYDATSDAISEDIKYEDAGSDISTQDAGPVDTGTKRGLLFSAIKKFKTKPSIFYVNPEGGVPQEISPDLSDEFTRPFWAPDGNSFYFESSGKIYKTPFGKFEPVEVCSGMDFAVSPDEKLIALNKYVKINEFGDYDYELFIYHIDTKEYIQITNFRDGEMENRPSSPSFSPDSKKILFSVLNPTGAYDVYSSDLFIYDIETGFMVNITNQAKKIQAKVANRSAEWATDINKYAYLHILYSESGYYLVEGLNNTVRISEETHNGIDGIAFSPNSNALAIATGLGKGIKIIDLKGQILYELPIIDLEYIDNLSWK